MRQLPSSRSDQAAADLGSAAGQFQGSNSASRDADGRGSE
jgi:hypothetical protein